MTTRGADEPSCADCDAQPCRIFLEGTPLCDRCFDARIARSHGWPRLPEPPAPETIVGPDGRRHRVVYRLWRSPGGIAVEAGEGDRSSDGYFVQVVGPHDADTTALVEQVKATIRGRIGRLDLEPSPSGGHWIMAGDDLIGRLVWREDGEPYAVVVDGRCLSWEEFGRVLEPFQGWEFRLSFAAAPDEDERRDRSAGGGVPGAFGPTPGTRVH
ncbi:MAG: hypothetical protein L0227_01930 [Chloroflexi bacterium]|nr:hypothetical protein [Chloroflexota bacterium]